VKKVARRKEGIRFCGNKKPVRIKDSYRFGLFIEY